MKIVFLNICFILLFYSAIGQKLESERKYEITGTAQKELLACVSFDSTDGFYRLFYASKTITQKVHIRKYTFDLDLNFNDMRDEEFNMDAALKTFDWLDDFLKNKKNSNPLLPFCNVEYLNYLKSFSEDSLENKTKTPTDESPCSINLTDYELSGCFKDSVNDVFISGQNIKNSTKIIQKKKVIQKKYSEVFILKFDHSGKFKNQFCINTGSNDTETKSEINFFENTQHHCIFMLLLSSPEMTRWYKQKLFSPFLFRIDMAEDSISTAFDLGKNDFYLEPYYPYLYNSKIHSIVFFGSDKSGRNIHFYKYKLD